MSTSFRISQVVFNQFGNIEGSNKKAPVASNGAKQPPAVPGANKRRESFAVQGGKRKPTNKFGVKKPRNKLRG